MTGMIIFRAVEHCGNVIWDERSRDFKTMNERWIVRSKNFDHKPTKEEVEMAYA